MIRSCGAISIDLKKHLHYFAYGNYILDSMMNFFGSMDGKTIHSIPTGKSFEINEPKLLSDVAFMGADKNSGMIVCVTRDFRVLRGKGYGIEEAEEIAKIRDLEFEAVDETAQVYVKGKEPKVDDAKDLKTKHFYFGIVYPLSVSVDGRMIAFPICSGVKKMQFDADRKRWDPDKKMIVSESSVFHKTIPYYQRVVVADLESGSIIGNYRTKEDAWFPSEVEFLSNGDILVTGFMPTHDVLNYVARIYQGKGQMVRIANGYYTSGTNFDRDAKGYEAIYANVNVVQDDQGKPIAYSVIVMGVKGETVEKIDEFRYIYNDGTEQTFIPLKIIANKEDMIGILGKVVIFGQSIWGIVTLIEGGDATVYGSPANLVNGLVGLVAIAD